MIEDLKTGQGKLIDFDMWQDVTGDANEIMECCGTLDYTAPELLVKVILKKVIRKEDLKPADVFALGVSLYEIFSPAGLEQDEEKLYKFSLSTPHWMLDPLELLILDMTAFNPSKRPTMEQVAERFQELTTINVNCWNN